jgi:hypothetical protein
MACLSTKDVQTQFQSHAPGCCDASDMNRIDNDVSTDVDRGGGVNETDE